MSKNPVCFTRRDFCLNENMWKVLVGNVRINCIFISVFHRILDFKTGLDFYPSPFFLYILQSFYKAKLKSKVKIKK
jgi:hypothetical protein